MSRIDIPLMDAVVDSLDDQLLADKFENVDSHLQGFRIENFSIAEMLAILTITHAAKYQLLYYQDFYERVKIEITERGKDAKRLMKGLE